MSVSETEPGHHPNRHWIAQAVVAAIMIGLAFFAIAGSDVTTRTSLFQWSALSILYGVVTFATDRIYTGHAITHWQSALGILLNWVGVFLAMHIVHLFVASGRMANADLGLTCGLMLALGTFIAGAYGSWRLLIVGATLAAATAAVALVEQYLWILLAIALLALAVLVIGSRVMPDRSAARV